MRKFSLACVIPVISLPVMVTRATCPESTQEMNSLKVTGDSLRWSLEEKFQTTPTTTTIATQNTRLLTVEFKPASGR